MTIPDGFRPHTLASLIARNLPLNESIGKDLAKLAEPTIDERGELGPGIDLIREMEERGLIQFAEGPGGVPALFVAEDHEFPFPELRAVADRLLRYFAATGHFDTSSGVMVDGERVETPVDLNEWLDTHRHIVNSVASMARCSTRIVESTFQDWHRDGKLFCRRRPDGAYVWYVNSLRTDQGDRTRNAILEAIKTFYTVERRDGETDQPPPNIYQHRSYMRAVEAQYAALTDLEEAVNDMDHAAGPLMALPLVPLPGKSPTMLWGHDIAALRAAETVCWFAEPLHAVDVAAASILPTTAIHRDMTPEAAGWWFFMEPYPIRTTREQQAIVAVLWHWTIATRKGVPTPGVSFSAYVTGENGRPTPSALFFWPEATSLDSLMAMTRDQCEAIYGSPSDLLVSATKLGLLGRDQMMHVVERLARFWAAGVVWMNQKILTYTSGSIERHERKRLARGAFQRALTDVQVIELRRRMSVPMTAGGPTEHHNVDWQCRWIVRGHFREQWYPSKGEHRTIFIEPHDKGPADLPLKVPTHTVYTVTR